MVLILQRRKLRHTTVHELAQLHSQAVRALDGVPGSLVLESRPMKHPFPPLSVTEPFTRLLCQTELFRDSQSQIS